MLMMVPVDSPKFESSTLFGFYQAFEMLILIAFWYSWYVSGNCMWPNLGKWNHPHVNCPRTGSKIILW